MADRSWTLTQGGNEVREEAPLSRASATAQPPATVLAPWFAPDRSRRVLVLLLGVVVLSLADLAATLTHLRTIGMIEANPIAAWLIATTRSPWALVVFKCGSVAVCVSLLYHLRRSRSAEVASWCAIGILVYMSLSWRSYVQHMEDHAEAMRAAQVWVDDGRLFLD